MKDIRKANIQRFYTAIKTYHSEFNKFEKMKIVQRLQKENRKAKKQANEKFGTECLWFITCLETEDDIIIMDLMNTLCRYDADIEKVYKIFELMGFCLID